MADREQPRPQPQTQAPTPHRESAEQRRARHTAEAIAKQADLKREAAERRARKSPPDGAEIRQRYGQPDRGAEPEPGEGERVVPDADYLAAGSARWRAASAGAPTS